MRALIVSMFAVLVVACSISGCQQPTMPGETRAASTQTDANGQRTRGSTETVQDLNRRLDEVAQKVNDFEAVVKSLDSKLEKLAERGRVTDEELVANLKTRYDQLAADLERTSKLVTGVAQVDRSGLPVPRVLGNMQASNSFREEMQEAVRQALLARTRGSLVIENRTASTQSVFVNEIAYHIASGQVLTVDVPLGTVKTQLYPYESPKYFPIVPPYYEQRLVVSSGPVYSPPVIPPTIPRPTVVVY